MGKRGCRMQSLKGKLTVIAGLAAVLILMMLGISGLARSARGEHARYREPDAEFAGQRYPYRQLDERGQKLYTALYQGISDYRTVIDLPGTYTADEYRKVYLLLTTQEPELFYLDTVYETADQMRRTEMFYTMPKSEAERMRSQMAAAADGIIRETAGARSDIQRLLLIHDRICAGCFYEKTPNADSAYGCLVEGMAMCEGYAKAFLYVARRAGLDVMCVPGRTNRGEAHIWNIAGADGHYYNIDLTWDDDDTYDGRTAHTCFAVPDSMFQDHMPDTDLMEPPACADGKQMYYHMRGFYLTESGRLCTALQDWNGAVPERIIEFRCINETDFRQVKEALRTQADVHAVLAQICGGVMPRIVADEKRSVIVILT